MDFLVEIIGWVGMSLVVLAYYLVSHKNISGGSFIYQLMNLVGAIFVGINVYFNRAWSSFALQCVWAMIAIFSLIKKKNK
jgi:hypothetical protein